MKVAVYGVGGVGGYFGGRLAQSGHDVTFICRGQNLVAIRENGLVVDSINGDFEINPAVATDQVSEIGMVDLVLVAVKAWQVPDAAVAILPLVSDNTMVVPLQNGVEAVPQLTSVLGKERVVGGLCKIISMISSPGHIRHFGADPYIAIGELDGSHSDRINRLKNAFDSARVKVEVPDNIQVALWSKFLLIAAWSGLGAITRSPIGLIRENANTRSMLESTMNEIQAVAIANGVDLRSNAIENSMNFIDALPHDATASMQRDIEEGRPSELESQNGAVVRLAKDFGVEVPVSSFIYYALSLREQLTRAKTS